MPSDELQELLKDLARFHKEESWQAHQEQDERRRAWHDGRASAYEDIIQRFVQLLDSPPPAEVTSRSN